MSEMFGLDSVLSKTTENLLEKKRELAIKAKLTDKDKNELRTLNEKLKHIDMTSRVRDPLFSEYVAIRTELGYSKLNVTGDLSKKEITSRKEKLKDIMQALEGKE